MAEVLASIAALDSTPPDIASLSLQRSQREEARARLLHALSELAGVLEDDGPFLAQVPVEIAALQRTVERIRERVAPGMDPSLAAQCAEMLASSSHDELYAGLLELVEPSIRRVLRRIDSETRNARLSAGRARQATDQDSAKRAAPRIEPAKAAPGAQ